jgi:hypothetical protein
MTNSRWFMFALIRSPRRRGQGASAALRGQLPCGLKIDDELELDRLLDGQVGRLLALEDAIDIRCRASKPIPAGNGVTRCVLAAPTEAFTPCQLRGLLSLRRA